MTKDNVYFAHNGLKKLVFGENNESHDAPATLLATSDRVLYLVLDSLISMSKFFNENLETCANYLNEITLNAQGTHDGLIDQNNLDYIGKNHDCVETMWMLYEFSKILGLNNHVNKIFWDTNGIQIDGFKIYGNLTYNKTLLLKRQQIFRQLYKTIIKPLKNNNVNIIYFL